MNYPVYCINCRDGGIGLRERLKIVWGQPRGSSSLLPAPQAYEKIENNKNNFEIEGGRTLHGSITTNMSKNGSVGLLCASLINSGTTTLHGIARIEEVYRVIEVLESIGVKITWTGAQSLKITPPQKYDLNKLNKVAALKTRSIIMLAGPLIHHLENFLYLTRKVVNSERGLSARIFTD